MQNCRDNEESGPTFLLNLTGLNISTHTSWHRVSVAQQTQFKATSKSHVTSLIRGAHVATGVSYKARSLFGRLSRRVSNVSSRSASLGIRRNWLGCHSQRCECWSERENRCGIGRDCEAQVWLDRCQDVALQVPLITSTSRIDFEFRTRNQGDTRSNEHPSNDGLNRTLGNLQSPTANLHASRLPRIPKCSQTTFKMVGAPISLSDIAVLIPPEDAALQRRAVTDLLRRDHMSFPGAQPVSFARKHLKELKTTDYFMCEKTDGIRCLLFLTEIPTEDGGMMEAQFLIDRKNDYYFVGRESLHIPGPGGLATYHTGTLLDGELVRQSFPNGKERLAYLVFDLLALAGENICPKPFDKRLARRDKFIGAPFSDFAKKYPEDVDAQPFHLVMKRMEFPYVAEMMFKEKIPNLPHGNDGLIFTCKDTPYEFGTDQHILKWKPPKENTIDFRLVLGEFPKLRDDEGEFEDWDACPDMELWVNHGGGKGYVIIYPLRSETYFICH